MAAGILHKKADVEQWLMQNKDNLSHGGKEAQIILHQLEKDQNTVKTTSCGRVLDAVASVLEICHERTYEGEPALKLESTAMKGKDVLKLQPIIKTDILDTTQMLLEVFEKRNHHSKADLAQSAHMYIAKGLACLAIEKAQENKVKTIGFSGGVACNEILALSMRKIVEAHGLKFLVHKTVPPGDGGLSFGQAVVGGFSRFAP
jgi:hydrogenase maturation protein HypF